MPKMMANMQAPDFSLIDTHDQPIKLSDFQWKTMGVFGF